MIKSAFRAYSNICYLILELVRQFYTEPRSFRITENGGSDRYIVFQNKDLLENHPFANYRPIFDIKIIPQKQSPYQKASQNELAKEMFSLGMLDPERRSEAKMAVKLMDFHGKEELLARLSSEENEVEML